MRPPLPIIRVVKVSTFHEEKESDGAPGPPRYIRKILKTFYIFLKFFKDFGTTLKKTKIKSFEELARGRRKIIIRT